MLTAPPFLTLPLHAGPIVIDVPSNYAGPIVIADRHLTATAPGQTAITIRWPRIESCFLTSVILRDLVINAGFRHGIHLVNAWNARIARVNIFGPGGVPDPGMENGIILDGQCMDVSISACNLFGMTTGILIVGEYEGTRISDFSVVGAVHGVAALNAQDEPGLWITNGHINATSVGVFLRHRCQYTLSNLLLYAGNDYASTKRWPFYGVHATDSDDGVLDNVKLGSLDQGKVIVPLINGGCDRLTGTVQRMAF